MVRHTQTIRRQKPNNCLVVFDHSVGLALKGLTRSFHRPIQQFHSKIVIASRESILKCIQSKIMKDCVKERCDMILFLTGFFKLCCNLIHSSHHKNKFILCKTNILKFHSRILQFLSVPFILSFILN